MRDNDVIKKKEEAINFFLNTLLKERERNFIGKIFLFGSMVQGNYTEDSDIDLIIFGTNNLYQIRNKCADASLETWIHFSESVEPLIYCIDEYRHLDSYFLYNVVCYGKEVYSMNEDELRREEVKGYLNLANEYLESAKRIFEAGDFRVTVDIAYNSAELCAKGLLLIKDKLIPKTHGGIIGEFGKVFVKTKLFSQKIGRQFNNALEQRNKARYDFHAVITKDIAIELLELVECLKERLEENIEEKI